MSKDPIQEYFINAVRLQALVHTGEDIGDPRRDLAQQIEEAPICEPTDGEFIDECAWSRTGWAIWKSDDGKYCTCRPALAPTNLTSASSEEE